jgi:aspartate aminotransferase-like enzyme
MRKRSITIAGGQGSMKGKMFRIAHMGYVDPFDVLTALGALEMVLADLGHPVSFGACAVPCGTTTKATW